jgi:hypothetical protein
MVEKVGFDPTDRKTQKTGDTEISVGVWVVTKTTTGVINTIQQVVKRFWSTPTFEHFGDHILHKYDPLDTSCHGESWHIAPVSGRMPGIWYQGISGDIPKETEIEIRPDTEYNERYTPMNGTYRKEGTWREWNTGTEHRMIGNRHFIVTTGRCTPTRFPWGTKVALPNQFWYFGTVNQFWYSKRATAFLLERLIETVL